jgi:hypothetical protein
MHVLDLTQLINYPASTTTPAGFRLFTRFSTDRDKRPGISRPNLVFL